MKKTKRLEVLERSLAKKQARFEAKLEEHFATVKQANGQPLNDKRNGHRTLAKWERQNDALRTLKESIAVTERAIERELAKIQAVEASQQELPEAIMAQVSAGTLEQWRKHPNTFFVAGVDKARIVWDAKKKQVAHKYLNSITDKDQWRKFAQTYNALAKQLNK